MKKLLIIALLGITAVSCSKEGCTDPAAYNYNADATSDDGSCTFEGCTDPNAVNYDANATMSSTCIYDQVGIWTSTNVPGPGTCSKMFCRVWYVRFQYYQA